MSAQGKMDYCLFRPLYSGNYLYGKFITIFLTLNGVLRIFVAFKEKIHEGFCSRL